ncbi:MULTISPECIES: hypothetical protein [Sporosarcina]|uniref:Preprotein translocase subunit SecA n=1 Tax=Sporosarcina contaminans TaxID=633403 RepID=A0ABW3U1C8_9BACL
MYSIHFYENDLYVLNQALQNIPVVNENIRIKGRTGKVISVEKVEENKYFVYVEFEKIVDKNKDNIQGGKKRKR